MPCLRLAMLPTNALTFAIEIRDGTETERHFRGFYSTEIVCVTNFMHIHNLAAKVTFYCLRSAKHKHDKHLKTCTIRLKRLERKDFVGFIAV